MKIRETATIISQECLCKGVYSMWLETSAALYAKAGQFISVYSNNAARLLPRPISICEIDDPDEPRKIRLVYRVAGAGTKEFSEMKSGDRLDIIGPLGNGFAKASGGDIGSDTRALLVGGGIGVPPMLELAKRLKCNVTIVAGYRSKEELFLTKELGKAGELLIATDDGSSGYCGTVTDAIKAGDVKADVIFACGPKPMLRAIKEMSEQRKIPAYISMEERMACGIGACLGCVCASTLEDEHSKVNNKRVCVDGPVFAASEVQL